MTEKFKAHFILPLVKDKELELSRRLGCIRRLETRIGNLEDNLREFEGVVDQDEIYCVESLKRELKYSRETIDSLAHKNAVLKHRNESLLKAAKSMICGIDLIKKANELVKEENSSYNAGYNGLKMNSNKEHSGVENESK